MKIMNITLVTLLFSILGNFAKAESLEVDLLLQDNESIFYHIDNGGKTLFEIPKTRISIERGVSSSDKIETIAVKLSGKRKQNLPNEVLDVLKNSSYQFLNKEIQGGNEGCFLNSSLKNKFLSTQLMINSANRSMENRESDLCMFYVTFKNDSHKEDYIAQLENEAASNTLITRDINPITLKLIKKESTQIELKELYEQTQEYVIQSKTAVSPVEAYFSLGYAMAKSSSVSESYLKLSFQEKEKFKQFTFGKFFKENTSGLFDFLKIDTTNVNYSYLKKNVLQENKYEF